MTTGALRGDGASRGSGVGCEDEPLDGRGEEEEREEDRRRRAEHAEEHARGSRERVEEGEHGAGSRRGGEEGVSWTQSAVWSAWRTSSPPRAGDEDEVERGCCAPVDQPGERLERQQGRAEARA